MGRKSSKREYRSYICRKLGITLAFLYYNLREENNMLRVSNVKLGIDKDISLLKDVILKKLKIKEKT